MMALCVRSASASLFSVKDCSRAMIPSVSSLTSTCYTEVSDMAAKKTTSRQKATETKTARTTKTNNGSGTSAARRGSASGLKIRMYRVGFGDFFLVTVPTRAGDRYILIDCGVFKGTAGTGDIGSIEEAVEDLFTTTGGKLALVIMTHRHADHIAGFSR